MKIDLTGRVAVISGGSGGLGEAMAQTLIGAGAKVALVARNKDKLEKVAQGLGPNAFAFVGDVTNEADVARVQAEVKARLGDAQILVNSAGSNLRKDLVDFTLAEFQGVVDSSLVSTFLMCRAFLPGMKGKGYGRVINLASMLANVSLPQRTAYSAGKSALLGLTRALALEVAADGITVNALSPGPFHTEINRAVIDNPEASKQFLANLPVGRWGKVEEIGGLTCYLCSDYAGFITGTDITIDGGWTAK